MTTKNVLQKHNLSYIPELCVDDNIFQKRFAAHCSMMNCKGNCCKFGVWADLEESKKILANAAMIQKYMEPQQDKNPAHWFDPDSVVDKDFPSGIAVGTNFTESGCVFLDSKGRCVLQKAAMEEGMDRFALKPFYCVAYPISVEDAVLVFDDEEYTGNPQCCSPVPDGTLNVFDICSEELEFTIGREGARELREMAQGIESGSSSLKK